VNSQEAATVAADVVDDTIHDESFTHGDAVVSDDSVVEQEDQQQQQQQEEETSNTDQANTNQEEEEEPVQVGPFIDLLGSKLQSLKLVDEQSAELREEYTNDALRGKTVVGLYFSADWYGSS
jgi:hypothetical protein